MKHPLPFKILYSNDFTNITTCVSPFHKKGQPFSPEMLEATVAEVAGETDAHFLQLATGRVLWYQSKIYSPIAHRDWYCARYGVNPDHPMWTTGINGYLLAGGDPLSDFVRYCRKYNQTCFVSLRLNDQHGLDGVDGPGSFIGSWMISRFYAEHPEYRLYPTGKRNDRVLNWACDEVRTSLLAIIEEQAANYDIDGFELDFQRHPRFFRLEETTVAQRKAIMNGFIREVRTILDQHTKNGKRTYLSVRVPCYQALLNDCGLDAAAFDALGVDLCVVSDHYFSSLDTEFGAINDLLGDVPAFYELCHTTYTGRDVSLRKDSCDDVFSYRRTTPEQYRTIANVAYHQGASGISFYNFAYYREYGNLERGPFAEPPFPIIGECRDENSLAAGPQDYLLTPGWSCWTFDPVNRVETKQLPRILKDGITEHFRIELYPREKIQNPISILRLQTEELLTDQTFSVTWNGIPLSPTDEVHEPFGIKYPSCLGTKACLRAFALPTAILLSGENHFSVTMTGGNDVKLIIVNLPIC